MDSQYSPESSRTTEPRWKVTAGAVETLRHACAIDTQPILNGLLAGYADTLRQLGQAQQKRGDHAAAVSSALEALVLRPDDPILLSDLGIALRGKGDLDAAIAAFRRAVDLAPTSEALWYNLGKALTSQSHTEQAKSAFETALAIAPGFTEARGALGDVLGSTGDSEGAAVCYRICARERAHAPRAWSRVANLKTLRMSPEDIVALRHLAGDPTLNDNERIFVGYALSKALEDQHDYQDAFAVLSEASRIKRKQVFWDARKFSDWIGAIDTAFARPAAGTEDSSFGREVIFVLGMPRSGSTLTEQILASHSQIEGASELTDLHAVIDQETKRRDMEFPQWVPAATPADWRRLGEDYMRRTERWRQMLPRFTDKGLDNWPLIGAAAAMLPGARFVNCRRDAVETCLACYRQLFHFGNQASYDLTEIAASWRDYDRLSRAWRERYPGRVFEEVYEELVADPEAQVRRLLEFLGLPFEPDCLEFHRSKRAVQTFSSGQVRQPLRKDTARAHLYGAALDPLRKALRAESDRE
jgi:tetratricopeptide (TPR) repeat protein